MIKLKITLRILKKTILVKLSRDLMKISISKDLDRQAKLSKTIGKLGEYKLKMITSKPYK